MKLRGSIEENRKRIKEGIKEEKSDNRNIIGSLPKEEGA